LGVQQQRFSQKNIMMPFCVGLVFLLVIAVQPACAYDNGLGLTPPMGWNSWNRFHCGIDETLVQETAQAMITLGLQEVGYTYVNLDDCWQVSRNATGYIQEDLHKFPSGIPALREYVHSLRLVGPGGLKFGLYSDAGIKTCQGRPGGLGYETQDAATYAEWKIDYLKYDNCYNTGMDVQMRYQRMHDALNATGHALFFSLCEWGIEDPATWAGAVGNSWRTTGDISPNWNSITKLMDINDHWHAYAGPGGWNDPDMLEVGNGKLTLAEQRSHFTMWCLMKSPLLLGNDLRTMDDSVLDIITNTEVIALNQDVLGVQGYKRRSEQDLEVWAGDLSDNHVAVVLFNRSNKAANITAEWKEIGISTNCHEMQVRDLWAHQDMGIHSGSISAMVGSHEVVAFRLMPMEESQEEIGTEQSSLAF
jgi:alpha-galactosidase